jgi:hypothetical protein
MILTALRIHVPMLYCVDPMRAPVNRLEAPSMKKADRNDVASVKLVTREIDDHAKVRIGGQIPLFSPVPGPAHIAGKGKVRMGATSPSFAVARAT